MEGMVTAMDDMPLHDLVRPQSANELREVVGRAATGKLGLFPIGGGTMMHVGRPPSRQGIGIDLTGMNQVVDYPARDMTITVQAGITMARLNEILAAERQRLPIDVPQPTRATVGGSIACNISGPRRLGFGTFRDYVIGIRFLDDQGREVQGGGRVVKNVAGYDLCKLHTGAFGSLGIITQVTLKLRPMPEAHASVTFSCPVTSLGEMLDRLHASATRPAYVDAEGMGGDRCRIVVGFEDNAPAVAWQVEQIQREFPQTAMEIARDHVADDRVRALTERMHSPAVWSWKASLPSSAVAGFVQNLPQSGVEWQAQALSGIVWGRAARDLSMSQAAHELESLRRVAEVAGGSVVVWRCPIDWKTQLDPYGKERPDWRLMQAVKRQVDPHNLFNPGRFIFS